MSYILVIEDDEDIRVHLLRLLRAEGYDVTGAVDGRAGLELAQTTSPDLVLCDVMMPLLDGYGVLAALRESPATAELPLIFLTSRADRMDIRRAAALGVEDYLTKPFARDDVLLSIRHILRRDEAVPEPVSPAPKVDLRPLPEKKIRMEAALRRALSRHEISVVYQPQVSLFDGAIIGAEALLRWKSAEFGNVSPMEFIPLAEETDLILQLGEWVLREACRQAEEWRSSGISGVKVGVNVSIRQLRDIEFGQLVERILSETGLPGALLDLEITESALAHDLRAVATLLNGIKALGVSISMDDFGTGYSGLSSLRQLPFDKLKIDRSFVTNLPHAVESSAIVGALMQMARVLGMETIAEGVETREELAYLRIIGCDQMQGYLFSRPVPPDEFVQLLVSGKTLE